MLRFGPLYSRVNTLLLPFRLAESHTVPISAEYRQQGPAYSFVDNFNGIERIMLEVIDLFVRHGEKKGIDLIKPANVCTFSGKQDSGASKKQKRR